MNGDWNNKLKIHQEKSTKILLFIKKKLWNFILFYFWDDIFVCVYLIKIISRKSESSKIYQPLRSWHGHKDTDIKTRLDLGKIAPISYPAMIDFFPSKS